MIWRFLPLSAAAAEEEGLRLLLGYVATRVDWEHKY